MCTVPAELHTRTARTMPSGVLPFEAAASATATQFQRSLEHERPSAIAARARKFTREHPAPRELDPEHPLMGPHPTD